jgi:hypothetical protein
MIKHRWRSGNAGVCKTLIREFESHSVLHASLAQLVEHLTCNEDVVGSIPTGGSIFYEIQIQY